MTDDLDIYANTFIKEPAFNCPQCNAELHTDWVDNGFGPYSIQASPYGCECGWHETGCSECIKEKCFSWAKCQGRALVNPASGQSSVNNMLHDPNQQQQESAGEAAEVANEQATQEQATESAEEKAAEE